MFDFRTIRGEEGAVSPDFAVIAVMLVGLGIAVTSTIGGGTADLAENVEGSTNVNDITIVAQADDDTEYNDEYIVDGGEPTDDWNGYPDDPLAEEPPA